MDYLNHDNSNLENLTGDDLNKKLEEILATPEDAEALIRLKDKAYKAYLKSLAANANYRKHNRETNLAYKAQLYSNPEYKAKLSEYRKTQYYIKKYGVPKEEYLKAKAEKNQEFIKQFINNTAKKSRFLSYEQFSNKYNIPKIVICN